MVRQYHPLDAAARRNRNLKRITFDLVGYRAYQNQAGLAVIRLRTKRLSRNNISIWQPLAGARGSEIPIQSRDREGVLDRLFRDSA